MPQHVAYDNFATTLAGAVTSSSQTTLDLTALPGTSYPYLLSLTSAGASGPPYAKVEVVEVTSLSSGTTVNVTRGYGGTAAQASWAVGDSAACEFTASSYNDLVSQTWPLDWSRVMLCTDYSLQNNTSGSGTVTGFGDNSIKFTAGTTAASGAGVQLNTGPGGSFDYTYDGGVIIACRFQILALPAVTNDAFTINYGTSAGGYGGIAWFGDGLNFVVYYTGTALSTEMVNNGSSVVSSVQITDTNWHTFRWLITKNLVTLYIDNTLAIQTSSVLPTPAAAPAAMLNMGVSEQSGSTTDLTVQVFNMMCAQVVN